MKGFAGRKARFFCLRWCLAEAGEKKGRSRPAERVDKRADAGEFRSIREAAVPVFRMTAADDAGVLAGPHLAQNGFYPLSPGKSFR
ncbi:MAG: hypothetical protein CW346_14795 [Bacillaceae bacterium]|nr:hypothetical protein [Bacillaceae bacterium]MBY6273465.1 hypothetical protein [Bacillaceae bacterium]OUM86309.1 MAG: hypothetical protein BAA03_10960 [Caldibacillus debilis]